MSLVADYGSDSSDDETNKSESDSDSSSASSNTNSSSNKVPFNKTIDNKLPIPNFVGTSTATSSSASVFTNPYKQAENAKRAILEKHVKMVKSHENVKVINGKKICWNYRKGRCRFGHNCKYAHDSDIQMTDDHLEVQNQLQTGNLCQNNDKQTPEFEDKMRAECVKEVDVNGSPEIKRKKRPGLTQGLIPNKKVMKTYHKLQGRLKK